MNFSDLISITAKNEPERYALTQIINHKPYAYTISYFDLYQRTQNIAAGLHQYGIKKNQRILMMLTPGIDFLALSYALFYIGAVPIFIDPAVGIKRLRYCIREAQADVLCASPKALWFKEIFRKDFSSIKTTICIGKSLHRVNISLATIEDKKSPAITAETLSKESIFAIFYTSGSTGTPKGVEWRLKNINAQLSMLQQTFQLPSHAVDLVTFPLFLFLSTAIGNSCVLPVMDFSHPAKAKPKNIVSALNKYHVDYTFASPALWQNMVEYCEKTHIQLTTLSTAISGGAPVQASLIERLQRLLPHGCAYTPYGATEALPITAIDANTLCKETNLKTINGAGICLGLPIPPMEIKIIALSNLAFHDIGEVEELPQGKTGEIFISGPVVTESYFRRPDHNKQSKVRDKNGKTWHRTGDCGYLDQKNRLWFCGREKHIVQANQKKWYNAQVEAIFNNIAFIKKSALIGLYPDSNTQLALIIHNNKSLKIEQQLNSVKAIAIQNNLPIQHVFIYRQAFPVDRRHNAKIDYENLSLWAHKRINSKSHFIL